MSVEAILRNVYNFLEVLQNALSDKVKDWDTSMIDDTLRWGTFGQQLYRQAKDKPYQSDLDQQIQKVGQLNWAVGNLNISLDILEHAETLMKESLLQNPWLRSSSFNYVLQLYDLDTRRGVDDVIEFCERASRQKASLDVHRSLLVSSESSKSSEALQSLKSHQLSVKSAQLLRFVASALMKTPHQKKQGTVTFLKKKICMTAKMSGGIAVLASALMCHQHKSIFSSEEHENEAKTVILQAIRSLPEASRRELKKLLQPKTVYDSSPR